MDTIKIGTRRSELAVIQAKMVKDYIILGGKYDAALVTMKTTGDKILNCTLDKIGGKGLFIKELDMALQDNLTDLSVHSLKDVPMEISEKLPLIGFSKREDPRDVLVLPKGCNILKEDKPLGCSSQRRKIQLKKIYPRMEVKSVRGNVLTRIEKLDRGEYSGLILAAAGLKRLKLEGRINRYFSVEEMLPAAGQGILAIQGIEGRDYSYLKGFFHEDSYYTAICERAFVKYLNGGCSSPIAAYAIKNGNAISLTGLYAYDENGKYCTKTMTDNIENAKLLGIELAKHLKNKGMDGK